MAAMAHSLRGACASIGALAMASDLAALEQLARGGHASAPELERIGARVEARLRALVQALQALRITG